MKRIENVAGKTGPYVKRQIKCLGCPWCCWLH